MSKQLQPGGKRDEIQWLRAVAALEVVVWHSDLVCKHFSDFVVQQAAPYAPMGGIGVELFFVISGFIIGSRVPTYPSSLVFLRGRILRIIPLYSVFTTAALLGGLLVQNAPEPLLILKSFLIFPVMGYPLLGVGWTLEHEMLFYLLVALGLGTIGLRDVRTRLALGALMTTLAAFGFCYDTGPQPEIWDWHLLSPYWLAFALGWTVAALEELTPLHRRIGRGIMLAGILGLAALPMPASEVSLLYRITGVGIVFAASGLMHIRHDSWCNRWMSRIGDASFSLYLSHTFILSLLGKLLRFIDPPDATDPVFRFVGVAICIGFALLVHYGLEGPLDHVLRGTRRSSVRPTAPAAPVPWPAGL